MTTEIAKYETPVEYAAIDAEIGGMDGDPLRFNAKTGQFLRGFDQIEMKLGARLLLHPLSYSDGYQEWRDGKPGELRIRQINSEPPILRGSLGDIDEKQWPDGKDPWTFIKMIAMKDEDGVQLAFTASASGSKNALTKVLREWRLSRHKHVGQVPVIELQKDSYFNETYRTDIEFPVFRIVDWATWDGQEVPPLAIAQAKEMKEELNDELPDFAKCAAA
jgi:hypothetical protein